MSTIIKEEQRTTSTIIKEEQRTMSTIIKEETTHYANNN